nr:reverse transcriptase domain-containing protein [Tanacetum cinerariifolium]
MANTTPIVTTATKAANNEKTPRKRMPHSSEKKSMLGWTSEKVPRKSKSERGLSKLKCWDLARKSTFDRLSDTYSPSTTKSKPDRVNSRDHSHSRGRPRRRDSSRGRDHPQSRDRFRGIEESYGNTCSSHRTGAGHRYHSRVRGHSRSMKRGRESESLLSRVSESGTNDGGHWKSNSKRRKATSKEDLAVSWSCEEVDPFTPRICNFKSSRKTRMPNNVKTYEGTGDPGDHVKIFQAAAYVKCWEMPMWCHMFNSTLIGTARVWFDELPPECIDGYKDLKAAFLAYFMQQKKYVKDPVEIHNIKQKDRETIKDFIETSPSGMFQSGDLTFEVSQGKDEALTVPSTTNGMLQFSVDEEIVTIRSTILIPIEYATMTIASKEILKESEVRHKNFKVALHLNFPDQEVAIGGTLSAKGQTKLCSLLKEKLDIFAWHPSDMMGVPQSVAEHQLNIREGYTPVRQKKRGQALKRVRTIQVEVQKLVEAGIMREVYYHDWLSKLIMVKKHDGSWRMCVDFTDLNKACSQDCYPLPKIDWKVESLCGYPFKCFLDAYKGYHQIHMAESDEEKTAFHTSHLVYC